MTNQSSSGPEYEYIAYIDEAGDPGIKTVRPIDEKGGTEWIVIGAALIRKSKVIEPPLWVGNILKDIDVRQRPDLHFRKLSPTRQKRVCELMGNLPAVYFTVASNKRNMRGYTNVRAAKISSQQWFYNWLCRILIERISDFVLTDSKQKYGGPKKVKFEFSDRGGHSYSQTKAYHYILNEQSRAQVTFLNRRVPKWQVLDFRLMENHRHEDRAGLQLADVVASAFYTAVDNLETGPCFIDPARLLAPRMGYERNVYGNKIIKDYGLVLQPTPDWEAPISEDQKAIFKHYGYDFKKKW